jgi:hypothetical protein
LLSICESSFSPDDDDCDDGVCLCTVGTLGISAGAPWVRVIEGKILIGKKGSVAKLSESSIKVDTNVDTEPSKIMIRILDGPQHGLIRV